MVLSTQLNSGPGKRSKAGLAQIFRGIEAPAEPYLKFGDLAFIDQSRRERVADMQPMKVGRSGLQCRNAGLGTYISWQHVMLRSFEFDIPFVVTDYCETCLVDVQEIMDSLHQGLTCAPESAKKIQLRVRCSFHLAPALASYLVSAGL